MTVSFEGMGESIATFYNTSTEANRASAGLPVKMSGNGEVSKCADGDGFIGACLSGDDDFVSVRTGGYVRMTYSGAAPTVGYCRLAANGDGGVKLDAGSAVTVTVSGTAYDTTGKTYSGGEYLVLEVDTTAHTVGFII